MKILILLNNLIILNCKIISLSFCYFENINTNYYIYCTNKETTQDNIIKISNFSLQQLTLIDFNLIINGKDYLNIIINDVSLKELTILSLDLSFNNNDFEAYFTQINKLIHLKSLNLSHNNILMIKEKQFDSLFDLNTLDLSSNQLFYFESNAFFV